MDMQSHNECRRICPNCQPPPPWNVPATQQAKSAARNRTLKQFTHTGAARATEKQASKADMQSQNAIPEWVLAHFFACQPPLHITHITAKPQSTLYSCQHNNVQRQLAPVTDIQRLWRRSVLYLLALHGRKKLENRILLLRTFAIPVLVGTAAPLKTQRIQQDPKLYYLANPIQCDCSAF